MEFAFGDNLERFGRVLGMAQYSLVVMGNIGGATPREDRAMPDLTNHQPDL